MASNLSLFVGLPAALQPFLTLLPSARIYTLQPDANLAVLPFDEDLQDCLHDRFGTGDWPDAQGIALSTTDQAFAATCSQQAPLAFVQLVDDGAGEVFQSAAAWQSGRISIGPVTLDMSAAGARRASSLHPINIALRTLGVIATAGADEFTAFGLAAHTSNADIHAHAWPQR